MIKKVVQFLNQPYPDEDDLKSIIKGALTGGLVVSVILALFQPFGLHEAGSDVYYYCLIFGLISFVVAIIFDLISVYVLGLRRDSPDWTLWKWVISITVMVLLIAAANFTYISYAFVGSFDPSRFGFILYITAVVGIFPVFIFGTLRTIKSLKANQQLAQSIKPKSTDKVNSVVDLPILKSKATFKVDTQSILYIEAMQNYVNVYYTADNEINKEVIRNTLTAIEKAIASPSIVRCHRSYLVNIDKINKVEGNAQGLQLHLRDIKEKLVPVSRKYIPIFKD